jgi:nucleoside-triphosphatase THEP1
MSTIDLEMFINRDKEIALVMDTVSRVAKGEPFAPKERVFHFVGPSGIGKSSLLEKIRSLLGKEYRDQGVVPILVRLDTLKGAKQGFVVELLKTVYEEFCKYSGVIANPVLKESLKSKKEYASMTVRAIFLRKEMFPVLLLDEINIPSQKDMQEIEEYLLVNLLHNNRAILITAGRSLPSAFNDFALRHNSSNTFLLSAFDEEKTGKQMESLKLGSRKLAGKVMKLGNGVPGNTAKLVQHIVGDPLDIPNATKAVQSLLDEIKETNDIKERHHPMLEAISILQGFFPEDVVPLFQNHPQLGAGWGDGNVKEEFLKLKDIQIGPGGLVGWDRDKKCWVMDENTRDLFERELQMRDPELWRKLHCTALEMYREWWQKYNSDIYRNKSIYHQQCLQSAGVNCE